jgi:hypothetical protein
MENIQPTYATFEQAKWLKEIGFNEKCSHYYIDNFQNFKHDGTLYKCGLPDKNENKNLFQFVTRKNQPHLCNAPEQWQVVEWLRVNHGIWIGITLYIIPYGTFYSANVQNNDNKHTSFSGHSNPQEAYSAAFDYILKKLI